MTSVRFATAMLPCLMLLGACSETPVARGRGGGGSGGSSVDTGSFPADTSGDGSTADVEDGADGSATVEDTSLDDIGNDTAVDDTAVADTAVADTAIDDTTQPDTTPTDT